VGTPLASGEYDAVQPGSVRTISQSLVGEQEVPFVLRCRRRRGVPAPDLLIAGALLAYYESATGGSESR